VGYQRNIRVDTHSFRRSDISWPSLPARSFRFLSLCSSSAKQSVSIIVTQVHCALTFSWRL
jgi:hypothetical protein